MSHWERWMRGTLLEARGSYPIKLNQMSSKSTMNLKFSLQLLQEGKRARGVSNPSTTIANIEYGTPPQLRTGQTVLVR